METLFTIIAALVLFVAARALVFWVSLYLISPKRAAHLLGRECGYAWRNGWASAERAKHKLGLG